MFYPTTIKLFLLLASMYKGVKIVKPNTSRVCNSERYIVCNSFNPPDGWEVLLNDMIKLHQSWSGRGHIKFLDFCPLYELPVNLKLRMQKYNNKIVYNQVSAINECLKIIYSNDTYLKDLFFNMFFNRPRVHDLILYKNQFAQRINKCLSWLRYHDIQTSRFFQSNY